MTFEQFQILVTIADEGSINRAARKMGQSQPRLSKSLQSMENELGVQIFARGSRGSILTVKGAQLYEIGKRILREYRSAEAVAGGKTYHTLHLSAGSLQLFTEAFTMLCRDYQDEDYQDLTISQAGVDSSYMNVYSGEAQMGCFLLKESNLGEFQEKAANMDLKYLLLHKLGTILTVRKDHPILKDGKPDLSKLKNYPYVDYIQRDVANLYRDEIVQLINPNKVVLINDRDYRHRLVSKTNAFGIGCELMKDSLEGYGLVKIPLHFSHFRIVVVWKSSTELTEEMKKYIKYLKELIQENF